MPTVTGRFDRRRLLLGLLAAPVAAAAPGPVRLKLTTDLGSIVIELHGDRAPITVANFLACADQRLLRQAIPENRLRVYDIRAVIELVADSDSVLELRRGFGTGVGFLIGEGSARATFAAQYETHDKRISAAESQLAAERIERAARDERDRLERARDLEADRQERAKIIEKIGLVAERMSGVEGSLTTIKETLRRRQ